MSKTALTTLVLSVAVVGGLILGSVLAFSTTEASNPPIVNPQIRDAPQQVVASTLLSEETRKLQEAQETAQRVIQEHRAEIALALETVPKVAPYTNSIAGCTEYPQHIKEMWDIIGKVTVQDPEYSKIKPSVDRLEKCRQKAARYAAAGIRKIMVDQRIRYAHQVEVKFLDDGVDATLSCSGQNKENLSVITWLSSSRVWLHRLSQSDFQMNLRTAGFQRVRFCSPGGGCGEYNELHPDPEVVDGNEILSELGLGYPLRSPDMPPPRPTPLLDKFAPQRF